MSTFTDDFIELYRTLMKNNLMSEATPAFGKKPTLERVRNLIAAGRPHLPAPFHAGYASPLLERLDSVSMHQNSLRVHRREQLEIQ